MAAEPGEAVAAALEAARRNRSLGAFWSLDHGAAKAAAEGRAGGAGGSGGLAGVPVAVKDLFDVKGLPTTAGLPGPPEPAPRDAEAVRLLRAAGAIPIGKTAMDQLAATTGGQAPGFPPCVNPLDPALSPGGSSTGSAVAVAAGIVPLALGSDTAGSVRVPAAYCGVVGFKPATRAIPRAGSVGIMPGFDTAGLLAPGVAGCVQAYRALTRRPPTGHDPRPDSRPRIALLTDLVGEAAGEVASVCEGLATELGREAAIARAELGWRAQGFGVALAWELASSWGDRVEADPGRFTGVIRETVAFGRSRGAEGHERALAGIRRARERLRRRLSGFTAVLCPTVPVPTPDRERETTETSTRFTRVFSALGWPAFSLPAGIDAEGRPIAVQVASPPARVEGLIAAARLVERTTERMGIRKTMSG